MKFVLLDRIVALEPGRRITAVKGLTLAEEYLADHFPTFPVMPGVLMIEALVQASAWLVRVSENFAHSQVLLREAKNVTYKSFVSPGKLLELEVKSRRIEAHKSEFEGVGRCGDEEMVRGRWTLGHSNLADEDATMAEVDRSIVEGLKRQYQLLRMT
jgi:3-hydroxyacyl-[acyl-carrier-protein] dehydratase